MEKEKNVKLIACIYSIRIAYGHGIINIKIVLYAEKG